MTIQSLGSSSTETGCVASGVGGVLVTGAVACPGGGPFGAQNANSISLDNLALTLWNLVNGLILDAKYISAPVLFASSDPGAGNAGFGFKLDRGQAATENGILAPFPDLRIGLAANASLATGGLETFSIGVVRAIPEPGAFGLMIVGLVGLIGLRKRLVAPTEDGSRRLGRPPAPAPAAVMQVTISLERFPHNSSARFPEKR